jgi:hypothetical protein
MTTNSATVFIKSLSERAAKTAAQAAILALGLNASATAFNISTVNWWDVGYMAAGGAILSILTSIASGSVTGGSTSLVNTSIVNTPAIAPAVAVPPAAAPATVTNTKDTTMGLAEPATAKDGITVYQTDTGNPVTPPAEVPVTPTPSTPAEATAEPVETVPPIQENEQVTENPDGSVVIGGVTYYPNSNQGEVSESSAS